MLAVGKIAMPNIASGLQHKNKFLITTEFRSSISSVQYE